MLKKIENQVDSVTKQEFSQEELYIQFVRHAAFCTQEEAPDTFAQAEDRHRCEGQIRKGVESVPTGMIKRLYRAAKLFPMKMELQATLWPFLLELKEANDRVEQAEKK